MSFGLLSGAFRPQGDYAALPVLARLPEMLLRCQAKHIQHIQKALLLLMNILLTEVLSDVMGETRQKIIRAILAGERDGEMLAKYRNGHVRASEVEITKALQGSWRDEHLFSLKVAVELYDFYAEQLVACDQQIEQQMKDLARYDLAPEKRKRRGGKSKNTRQV
jgi:transposase